jgi:hypothetical protein
MWLAGRDQHSELEVQIGSVANRSDEECSGSISRVIRPQPCADLREVQEASVRSLELVELSQGGIPVCQTRNERAEGTPHWG